MAAAAAAAGVRALHTESLHADTRVVGVLNLYSGQPGMTPGSWPTALARRTGNDLTAYRATHDGRVSATRLLQAMRNQQLLDQAIGVLMATHNINRHQARERLDGHARQLNGTAESAAILRNLVSPPPR